MILTETFTLRYSHYIPRYIMLCDTIGLVQVYVKGIQMCKGLQKVIYTKPMSGRGEIRNLLRRKHGSPILLPRN